MKLYSLGFLFSRNKDIVWLIRKNNPEWQRGLLNGIGGKVELPNETAFNAMVREFREEAGLEIFNWEHFCTISDDKSYECHCFFTTSDLKATTKTEEEINWYYTNFLPTNVIFNLRWLIPMALNFDKKITLPYWVKERCLE